MRVVRESRRPTRRVRTCPPKPQNNEGGGGGGEEQNVRGGM